MLRSLRRSEFEIVACKIINRSYRITIMSHLKQA